jgi:hypothetical protein
MYVCNCKKAFLPYVTLCFFFLRSVLGKRQVRLLGENGRKRVKAFTPEGEYRGVYHQEKMFTPWDFTPRVSAYPLRAS